MDSISTRNSGKSPDSGENIRLLKHHIKIFIGQPENQILSNFSFELGFLIISLFVLFNSMAKQEE